MPSIPGMARELVRFAPKEAWFMVQMAVCCEATFMNPSVKFSVVEGRSCSSERRPAPPSVEEAEVRVMAEADTPIADCMAPSRRARG
jgi:hypothetical protein